MMKKATILVIDDSPTEAKAITKILEKASFAVQWTNNATRGIALLQHIRPDLILMDIVMPGMNGFQATRRIARNSLTKDIPIIMLTTKDQETDKIWALRQGARAYIVKPFDTGKLLPKINQLLLTKNDQKSKPIPR